MRPDVSAAMPSHAASAVLGPLYYLVWSDPWRRARKLLQFAEVEAEGGRDLVRAAELTSDPLLRRCFLAHARDEMRHATLFRARGLALRKLHPGASGGSAVDSWIPRGERGLDDLRVENEADASLLAFIHLSEAAAARDFALCARALERDPDTRALFERILQDEASHMTYSRAELERIAPRRSRRLLWQARLRRLWRAYLRLASMLAGAIASVLLTIQYFVLLPPFAWLAKRAARRETPGWQPLDPAAALLSRR